MREIFFYQLFNKIWFELRPTPEFHLWTVSLINLSDRKQIDYENVLSRGGAGPGGVVEHLKCLGGGGGG